MISQLYSRDLRYILKRYKHNWIKPRGVDTGIKVYNCITRNKVPLILPNQNIITWYTCGPTVYDSAHIGHAMCYVKLDILQRILRDYFKYNVVTVMNITDVDDKIIKRANELNSSYHDIANKYAREFWNDMAALEVQKPNVILKVTDHVDSIVAFIQKLENNGQAYRTDDGSVYFHVPTCPNYGKLQNIEQQEDKKHTVKKFNLDFALWKHAKQDEPSWCSPWGNGRPGWHIECSALATHVLGSNIDVHAGGIDLRFPHHENEEAQSCAYHNTQQWVNYWLHTGFLHKKHSEKMSKSLKNTILIRDMLTVTNPQSFRMACVMSSYRSNMEYSQELLDTAHNVYEHYKNFLISCNEYTNNHLKGSINNDVLKEVLNESMQTIHDALCDDFDTPRVIKVLNKLSSVTNSMLHSSVKLDGNNVNSSKILVIAVSNLLRTTLHNFGFVFDNNIAKEDDISSIMDILNKFRQDVRLSGIEKNNKDLLDSCDKVRNELRNRGIIIRDHGRVSTWST